MLVHSSALSSPTAHRRPSVRAGRRGDPLQHSRRAEAELKRIGPCVSCCRRSSCRLAAPRHPVPHRRGRTAPAPGAAPVATGDGSPSCPTQQLKHLLPQHLPYVLAAGLSFCCLHLRQLYGEASSTSPWILVRTPGPGVPLHINWRVRLREDEPEPLRCRHAPGTHGRSTAGRTPWRECP